MNDNTTSVLEMIDAAVRVLENDGLPRLQVLKVRHSYMTILQLINNAVDLGLKLGRTLTDCVNNAYQSAIEADINTGTNNAPIVKAMLEVLYPDVQIG